VDRLGRDVGRVAGTRSRRLFGRCSALAERVRDPVNGQITITLATPSPTEDRAQPVSAIEDACTPATMPAAPSTGIQARLACDSAAGPAARQALTSIRETMLPLSRVRQFLYPGRQYGRWCVKRYRTAGEGGAVSSQVLSYQVDDSTAVKFEIEPTEGFGPDGIKVTGAANWLAAEAAESNFEVTPTWSRGIREADADPG
jgi:hypothetical protein